MEKYFYLLSLTLLLALSGCKGKGTEQTKEQMASVETTNLRLKIGGMTCTGCEKTIEAGLSQIDGIRSVDAVFADSSAMLQVDTTKVKLEKIKSVIAALGYSVIE